MPDGIPTRDDHPPRLDLLTANPVYKPFRYPWAYDAWLTQQRVHWLPEEVPLADDVKDWQKNLTVAERNLLTQIFRFFTQSDVEVNDNYMERYARVFRPTEIKMMLSAFAAGRGTAATAAGSFTAATLSRFGTTFSLIVSARWMDRLRQ